MTTTVLPRAGGLRVLPTERRAVGAMVLLNALICLGAVSVQTAGLGLFLDRFGPSRLAGAFLVGAIATALVSGAYLLAAARLPFPGLTVAVLGAIAAATAVEWLGVRAGWGVAVYLLPAWFQVVMAPGMLVYWAVADSLFDVRQARRLFGTLTGGRSLGFLVGGLAAPLLLGVIGTADLLAVAVVALAGAALLLRAIWRLDLPPAIAVDTPPPPIPAPGRRGRTLRALFAQRYHRAIIAFVTVWWIGYYVVDKLFLDAVAAHRVDPAAIAGFLGLFYALAAVAQLLVGAFGTARVTERFGFTPALLITPVALAVLAVVFTAVAIGGSTATRLLVLAVALKGVDHAVGFALDFAVHGLAYRPVPLAVVGKVATLAEGFGQAVGLGITALGLLAIEAGLRVGPVALGITLLVVTALWALLARDLAWRYRQALAGALTRRQFADRLALADRGERRALVAAAADPAPAVALFAARALGDVAPEELTTVLPVLARHPDAVVRSWAFDEAARRRDPALLGGWSPTAEADTLARTAGVRALVAAGADDATLAAWLADDDPAIRRGALEAALVDSVPARRTLGQRRAAQLLARGSRPEQVEALEALASRGVYVQVGSTRGDRTPTDAGAAAVVATDTTAIDTTAIDTTATEATAIDTGVVSAAIAAVDDDDPGVARAACRAAATLPPPHAMRAAHALVAAAGRPSTSSVAVAALGVAGPAAVEAIREALGRDVAGPTRRALAEALTRIDTLDARSILLDLLHDDDALTRAAASEGLAAARLADAPLPATTATRVELALVDRVAEHGTVLDLLTVVVAGDGGGDSGGDGGGDRGGDGVLFGALRLALRRVQAELVELAVLVARDPGAAGAALRVERLTQGRRPAEVVELLDPALAPATRFLIVPALERATRPLLPTGGRALPRATPTAQVEDVVASLIGGKGPLPADTWLRAAACHHAGIHRFASCIAALRTAGADPDSLVADTAARALARIDRQEEPAVLSIVETVVALKRASLFAETPDDVLAAVARLVEERQLDSGVAVVTEGEEGEELYVIASGRVAVRRGERLLDEIGDGGVFGEMAVLAPGRRSATVVTIEPTHLLVLEKGPLEELLRERPEIALAIIRVLVHNLRERVSELAALS